MSEHPDRGATPLSDPLADARLALSLLDLTDLSDAPTFAAIDRLCADAISSRVAAVCVWPRFVAQTRAAVAGSAVRVATVVNFPAGGTDVAATVAETADALVAGADEIDVVLPYRAFLAGDVEAARHLVAAVSEMIERPRHLLKVILETGEYPHQESVAAASRLAIDEGADFIKTSTGKTAVSATLDAARTMLDVIRASDHRVGLKPSGGIRDAEDARAYLALARAAMGANWISPATFRFGASGLRTSLLDLINAGEPRPAA